jgi:hypothetical protein
MSESKGSFLVRDALPRLVVWDDSRFPDWWWSSCRRTPTDCWTWTGQKDTYPLRYVVRTLFGCPWAHVFAIHQTCAVGSCVNPAHICLTFVEEHEEHADHRA